jgi:hypothetical protein
VPYFDDQELAMALESFEVIPQGRIMFVPAFDVKAAQAQQAKVADDTRLSLSTRKHLIQELGMLEAAFDDGAQQSYQTWKQDVKLEQSDK